VLVESPSTDPILLDLGTGLRFAGQTLPPDGPVQAHALVTHLHWDHVQGLPFFTPLLRASARLDVWGPDQATETLGEAFERFMGPPYFPVSVADLPGHVAFHRFDDERRVIGGAEVLARRVPHVGPTNGYRITVGDVSIAYVPDHQQPVDGSLDISDEVLELCDGVDLLIHDAQYTPEEFTAKSTWGHCTVEFALSVAASAGARRLVLFHHDPSHGDDMVDRLLAEARAHPLAEKLDEVLAAHEGLTISLSPADG
jgi:phosphoribosyl 1,2-cyclic phosphodiesterase